MPRDPVLDPTSRDQLRDPWVWGAFAAIAALAARGLGFC